MKELILVKTGEIILKGLNRPIFEDMLLKNIKYRLRDLGKTRLRKAQAAIYVEVENGDIDQMCRRLQCVFGIVSVSRVACCEKEMEAIRCLAAEQVRLSGAGSFKVESKRSDKRFPLKSPQISADVGGYVFENLPGIRVDVHNPDVTLRVEVRDTECYVYCQKLPGAGGMPTGTNGRGTLLLSGGIDSPVAGYMVAKRGVALNAVHFHSYPYTSERARDKVIALARLLSRYCGTIELFVVPFTECQLAINENCPADEGTIIMRRMMARIAQKIAEKTGSQALITGESLGQVASQTIDSLAVTNAGLSLPVFRPLIGMDKDEIVSIARKIDTFETSIQPYEDCCTVFVARHPKTRPVLADIEQSERALDWDRLINEAADRAELVTVRFQDGRTNVL